MSLLIVLPGVFPCHDFVDVAQWLYERFSIQDRFTEDDFLDLVAIGSTNAIEWLCPKIHLEPNKDVITRTLHNTSLHVLSWVLQHRNDPITPDHLITAAIRGLFDALKMLHAKIGRILNVSRVLSAASSSGSIDIVQWIMNTHPLISVKNSYDYITMDAIRIAHVHAGCRAISMYLETRCPLLFPKQSTTVQDARLVEDVKRIFCTPSKRRRRE